jgi:hypothetical protein
MGAVCPQCRGAGWLVNPQVPLGSSAMLMHCPTCQGDPVREAAAIRRHLGQRPVTVVE